MESPQPLTAEVTDDVSVQNCEITDVYNPLGPRETELIIKDDNLREMCIQSCDEDSLKTEEFDRFSLNVKPDTWNISDLSSLVDSPISIESPDGDCVNSVQSSSAAYNNDNFVGEHDFQNSNLPDEENNSPFISKEGDLIELKDEVKLKENKISGSSGDISSPTDSGNHQMCADSSRAAAMRIKIEEKLAKIEYEMNLQTETSVKSGGEVEDSDSLNEAIENIEILQAKRARSHSLIELKVTAISRLQSELDKAQKELKLKDEEVSKLTKIRDEVGFEIEDLTASLFEEANNMVREANVKQAIAERRSKEANMKLTMLQEEVKALKALIQDTAAPHMPSHLIPPAEHSQNIQSNNKKNIFRRTPPSHNRSPSSGDSQNLSKTELSPSESPSPDLHREQYEADPIPHKEFVAWRQNPQIDKNHPFLQRIYLEDINPCMNFENKLLASKALAAIEEDRIIIESISSKSPLPKKCALLEAPRFCRYKMNLGEEEWHYISSLGRNRITSICDFFCYLRYIEKGLIKHSIHEVFLEILKKRKNITLARLGLFDEQK